MATKNIKKTPSGSVAVHGSADDVHHVVGLGNVRVIIVPDGSSFFAQGLEIDFTSQGSTVEGPKRILRSAYTQRLSNTSKSMGI